MNDKMLEIKTDKDLKNTFVAMNKFKQGAYIKLSGVLTGRVTFHRLFFVLDNKNLKILLHDKLQNDIISIDKEFISKIERSIDNKKLTMQIESENTENEIITIEI